MCPRSWLWHTYGPKTHQLKTERKPLIRQKSRLDAPRVQLLLLLLDEVVADDLRHRAKMVFAFLRFRQSRRQFNDVIVYAPTVDEGRTVGGETETFRDGKQFLGVRPRRAWNIYRRSLNVPDFYLFSTCIAFASDIQLLVDRFRLR